MGTADEAESRERGRDGSGLFLGFFYLLRSRGLKITPTQWLGLVRGLVLGLHGSSLIGFYSLARSVLVKDESEMDDFDVAFAEYFGGVMPAAAEIGERILDWLENPLPPYPLDPAWAAVMDSIDVEALRREFERRLAEQTEKHDGGSEWIGTGGTSPFGHGGYHPGGIRVGGEGRYGSAVKVAAERRFREYRKDIVLDTRRLGVALKKMRALRRSGLCEDLDLDGTIDRTARSGGELELVFRAPRRNDLCLLLAMDVGGTMEPYRRTVDALFSITHKARHFKRFSHAYFHNCVYECVYADASFAVPVPLPALMRTHGRDARLVLVGDAYMYPGELTDRWGAIKYDAHNEKPGLHHLRALADHFRSSAWLNPMDARFWSAPSVRMIRDVFPMYPLTIEGVERLAEDLGG